MNAPDAGSQLAASLPLAHGTGALRSLPGAGRATRLSAVHNQLCRYAEALAFADMALGEQPEEVAAWLNRAMALDGLGRRGEALAAGQRAMGLAPASAMARYHQGERLLRYGQLTADAWALYDARLALNGHTGGSGLTVWTGEDIAGRTILLHAEQGLGDTLQFVRYAPLVAARAGRVILAVQPALLRLLHEVPGVDAVVPAGAPPPRFDVVCPLLSLPRAFGTGLAQIPPPLPYATPLPPWEGGGSGLRVGLAWAGTPGFVHDRHRSIPPAELAVLAGVPGVQFYGLQHHGGAPPTLPAVLGAIDLMPGVQDFADTAARIAGLDLVITVDTAVAHLAATMGKPVWLLSRYHGCWRWLEGRADSPWYPSLRLFRQPGPGDWHAVLLAVRQALAARSNAPIPREPRPA